MPYILNIETATEVCSVVVSKNEQIIFQREETKGPSHAALLGQFVDDALKELRSENIKLDAVAVSSGPGSYTGLRIGVSEAKGLCVGLDIPLIAISSLRIMANGILKKNDVGSDTLLCPMIDARRMEVYDMLLDDKLETVRPATADIIDSNSFFYDFDKSKIMFFGNGSDKCKEVLHNDKAIFIENIYPHAADMINLAEEAYNKKVFEDVAYFEPFYLKEFVATTPKIRV